MKEREAEKAVKPGGASEEPGQRSSVGGCRDG